MPWKRPLQARTRAMSVDIFRQYLRMNCSIEHPAHITTNVADVEIRWFATNTRSVVTNPDWDGSKIDVLETPARWIAIKQRSFAITPYWVAASPRWVVVKQSCFVTSPSWFATKQCCSATTSRAFLGLVRKSLTPNRIGPVIPRLICDETMLRSRKAILLCHKALSPRHILTCGCRDPVFVRHNLACVCPKPSEIRHESS